MTDTMQRSNLHIRNVDTEIKDTFFAWADKHGMNAAGAFAVLVNSLVHSSGDEAIILSSVDKGNLARVMEQGRAESE